MEDIDINKKINLLTGKRHHINDTMERGRNRETKINIHFLNLNLSQNLKNVPNKLT